VQRRELIQEGVAALLFAARRYDLRMETPFWGYASFWVRKAMQELVAEVSRPVALSDHAVRSLARVKAARREHTQAHGAEPTRAQLGTATGFTRAQLDSLLAIERTPRSFEEPLSVDEGTPTIFGDTVADPGAEQEYEKVLDKMEIQAVRKLADRLDERERTVLWGHYGLGQPARTLSRIGSDLGLTAERVRQIEKEALEKLRQAAAQPPHSGDDGPGRGAAPRRRAGRTAARCEPGCSRVITWRGLQGGRRGGRRAPARQSLTPVPLRGRLHRHRRGGLGRQPGSRPGRYPVGHRRE
jgi:RNA polymerase sigma factor (sigma-70 family)